MAGKRVVYPSLNGLRAISIMLVIFNHLEGLYSTFSNIFPEGFRRFLPFFTDGQLGVNVFFIISGFLITSLLIRENSDAGTISLKNFYMRRTLRIFPAYYFYLLVLLVLHLASIIYISNASWLTAVTYTKYFNWRLDWFTGHAWSLSVEEHFYLIFPLLFTFGSRTWVRTAFFLVLIVPLVRLMSPDTNDLNIFKRVDALAIGCLMAYYKDPLLELLGKHFKLLFYLSFPGIFLIGILPDIAQAYHLNLDPLITAIGTRHGSIANIFAGIIILYSVFGHRGLWFRLLNTKLFSFIGLLSYGIYLWQELFISGPSKYWVTSVPYNLVFVFSFALFSYYFIEKPFLKIKERFSAVKANKGSRAMIPDKQKAEA